MSLIRWILTPAAQALFQAVRTYHDTIAPAGILPGNCCHGFVLLFAGINTGKSQVMNMTEADYNVQIEGNRQAIAGYEQEIQELENKINELAVFKNEVVSLQDVLHDTADSAESQIGGMTNLWGTAVSVLNGSFFSNILNEIKGGEYRSADDGLAASYETIENKIAEMRKMIEEKQAAINSCSYAINSLQNEKSAYLAAQALEQAAQVQ